MEYEYFFLCQDKECQAEFVQVKTRISQEFVKTCPVCNSQYIESIIYSPEHVFIRPNITDVAQLMEANSKKMGKYGVEDKERQIKQQRDATKDMRRRELEKNLPSGVKLVQNQEHKPWYGKLDKKVDLTDSSAVDRYIKTGN